MKTIIMSLGGSVIVPNRIDVNFLINFKKIIYRYIKKNYRFVIYCGGGRTARNYQKAASKVIKLNNKDLDWLGIHATRLNAHFIKTLFNSITENIIVKNPTQKIKFTKRILIAAGWKPGWSTDYDAVVLAKNLKINTVINMSNIDYVYDCDPKKNKNAKKIKDICWKHYRKISGNKWKAGLNKPFDPVAAKEAEKLGLKVIIIGKNLRNFENLLNDGKFEGTIIT
ncbi:MAG: UMP kinase [Candidatus Woesearchaeota archaeon]|nr:UMP kinase [Candidatus Woesearchaeota archaeon]MDP6265926.1 UMP kinase [Candidatus Woesearchaeota archaeon]MDP7476525.1 UMP kinase [Candidatus Woesearchaeota archaeon]HJO02331.1 UMP kinase [Candidatus Woesearchaeota archaeon]